jgi:hypothetical protein
LDTATPDLADATAPSRYVLVAGSLALLAAVLDASGAT